MKVLKFLLPYIFVFSVCCSDKINESDISDNNINTTDTSQLLSDTTSDQDNFLMEDDCVFDTSAYKFTTEAIRNVNPDYRYAWNDKEKVAIVFLEGGDTLILHIGGCIHFNFNATYRTDSANFFDKPYLFKKTRWIAGNFFTHGFDENYKKILDNKKYIPDSESTLLRKSFSVTDTTLPENEYYDGFYFQQDGKRTEIGISGYVN